MFLRFHPYYAADDDGGTGGGETDGKVKPSDILNRYGQTAESALRMAEKLAESENANWQLREKNRTLRQDMSEIKGKLPADGAVVVSADDAKALEAYRSLGQPADLKSAIDLNGQATAELTSLKREKALAKAADAAGFKASVLTTLAGDLDIQTEATKDGKPLVYVVQGTEKTALTDYAAANWADFLPALQAQPKPGAPDINAGARGNGNGPTITDAEREAARRRYQHTF